MKKVLTYGLLLGIVILLFISIYNFLYGNKIKSNVKIDLNEESNESEADVTICKCFGIVMKGGFHSVACLGIHLMCSTHHEKPYSEML